MNEPETIERILALHTIAVVGCSANPARPSHRVAAYLQSQGYRIIPVNPGAKTILGETSYPTLLDIPGPVDVVDVFRRPEAVPAIVDATVQIGARALWLQDGVIAPDSAKKAEAAGLWVVMDDCMLRQHSARRSG
ncbi:MAG: CoA-binding protein [Candidatus Neomarinimicrobiota bacterium]|nr:MAG: CoA-binding protein [Candidatus Neomarinimicrobiota bacterium]